MARRRVAKDGMTPGERAVLRVRAEKQLKERKPDPTPRVERGPRRLLHDLEVHQTELQIQNEELRATRLAAELAAARYAELYEFAPMGYATLDENGTIRAINLAGAALLGRPRKELVRRRLGLLVWPEDRAAFGELLAEALAQGEEGKSVREVALAGAVDRHQARLTAALARPGSQEILLAFEDVSERKQREQERAELLRIAQEARARAEEANRLKDAFLAMLSHELRNPLTPIRNSLSILEQSEAGSERARRAGEVIHRQVGHMSRLVNDLLDVARIERGKVQLRRARFDLNDLARSAVEDHRSTFERDGVKVELRLAAAPVVVDADWDRMAQVVGNLLHNAAKFSHPGDTTRVTVSRDERESCAIVRVTDEGVGMDAGMLSRLFEPFVQADTSFDRGKGGLGLGVSLAKELVQMHGGRIAARSGGLGKGSEFEVRLPFVEGTGMAPAETRSPAGRTPRRVLVIEDNVDAANSLQELLELHGHHVDVAYDGPEGLARAREVRPEIVLCDMGLPGMSGCDVARAFRAAPELSGIYLVALSGYALPADVQRAEEAGFDRHVAKPPEPAALEELIARAPAGTSSHGPGKDRSPQPPPAR